MPTRNSSLTCSQELRPSSPKNPFAKKRFPSKNNIPLKKVSQLREREEHTIPLYFASEKLQEQDKENVPLRFKDANKTKLVRSCFNIKRPSVTIRAAGGSARQRDAAKKRRCKYSKLKIKVLMAAASLPSRSARIETSCGNPE
jgi:hypothetical protein